MISGTPEEKITQLKIICFVLLGVLILMALSGDTDPSGYPIPDSWTYGSEW